MMLEHTLREIDGVDDVVVSISEQGSVGLQLMIEPRADRTKVTRRVAEVLGDHGLAASMASVAAGSGSSQAESRDRPSVGSVGLAESKRGVHVAVRLSDDTRASRQVPADEEAVWRAVVDLLHQLDGRQGPKPRLESVDWTPIAGEESVVVVLSVGEHRRIGAAPATATRALAVARAIWTALD